MKRIHFALALAAFAALSAVSCVDNNEIQDSRLEEITLTGEIGQLPVTRTQIDIEPTTDGSLGILWSIGDEIGVFGNSTMNAKFEGTFSTPMASGAFKGTLDSGDSPKYAYYPYVDGATDSKAIPVTVASVQTYTSETSIAANDVKASDTPVLKNDGTYGFIFKPMVSILKTEVAFGSKLEAIGSSEKLQSIIFRQKVEGTGANRPWTGDFTLNLNDLSSGLAAVDGKTSSEITVKLAKEENGGISVGRKAVAYATIAPTIKKGDVIEIQLVTNVHKITFEVKALIDFKAGACYDIPLNLDNLKAENNCTVGRVDAKPPVFESFKFEIAKNASLLKKTAVLNTSTTKTEVKASEDFTCDIDKTLNTVSCCVPYLYNFTLAPTFTVAECVKVYCNGELQESGVSTQDFKNPVEYTLIDGTEKSTFTVSVNNTGLPVVVINVNSPGTVSYLDFSIPAKDASWSEADDIAVYKNGVVDLETAGCSIRLRGNTSSAYDKRPMAIKLNKKKAILGMPAHKRWVLLSPWTDMSLIRNYLAFNIAKTIQKHFENGPTDGSTYGKGLVWNPSGENVELVINGIHVGNYLLCEQIKIDKNRLPLTKSIFEDAVEKDGNTNPSTEDCSYLLEFDNNYDENWKFKTNLRSLPCLFKDDLSVTVNGKTYSGQTIFEDLKSYINSIESNLTYGNYTTAYESLDVNSVIDYWFVYEIAMNDEIQHPKSVYMYKDGAGKLCAGPVWDFDSQNFTNVDTEKNAYYYHTWSSLLIERSIKYNENPKRYYMWWPLLMKDQNYINRVKARWADVYPDLVDLANRIVEERREANRLSDYYNRKIWKVGNYLDPTWKCGDEKMEFDAVMDNLKYCYNKRLENLNKTISNLTVWK